MTDPSLDRWRLILGEPAADCTGALSGSGAGQDAALSWLYDRDEDLGRRGVRCVLVVGSPRTRPGEVLMLDLDGGTERTLTVQGILDAPERLRHA